MNDQLTLNDLRAYRAGQLSESARHRVEQLLLEYPFYADALEGLEALQTQATRSLPVQTAELRKALKKRVQSAEHQRRLMRLWVTTAVAAILLALAVAIYLIFKAEQIKPAPKHPASSATEIGQKASYFRPINETSKNIYRLRALSGK